MNKRSLMGLKLFAAVALIAVGAFITRQQLVALPAEAFGVLDKTDPSGIRYWVALGSGGRDANIGVRYDYETLTGIQTYIAWNKSEAARLLNTDISTFWVVVNFNGPQPREAFEQFVQDYDMEVVEYAMRAVEPPTALMPEGNRVTAKGGLRMAFSSLTTCSIGCMATWWASMDQHSKVGSQYEAGWIEKGFRNSNPIRVWPLWK